MTSDDIPDSNVAVNGHAKVLLKYNGHNVTDVWHVYPASNRCWPGYDVVLYSSYGQKRTAWLWYENGGLKIDTKTGWFEAAGRPPYKKKS